MGSCSHMPLEVYSSKKVPSNHWRSESSPIQQVAATSQIVSLCASEYG